MGRSGRGVFAASASIATKSDGLPMQPGPEASNGNNGNNGDSAAEHTMPRTAGGTFGASTAGIADPFARRRAASAVRRCWFATLVCFHACVLAFLAILIFLVWLAFVEPVFPADGWRTIEGGCSVLSADMTAIQGVIGNTDLIAQAYLSYIDGSAVHETRALATRQTATLGPKEDEAAWISELLGAQRANETVWCAVDNLNAYRVTLTEDEQPDGFVVGQMYALGALCALELYVLACLYVRRRLWLSGGMLALGGAYVDEGGDNDNIVLARVATTVWPCFWPRRAWLLPTCIPGYRQQDAVCCGLWW